MKRICLLVAVALVAASCIKSLEQPGVDPSQGSGIPNDFNWETTTDVSIAVAAPMFGGVSQTANVRVYCSPLLYDEYIVAKGVASANGQFRTSVTVPVGVADLYVRTTLPDGTSTVQSVPVAKTVSVPGAIMSAGAAKKSVMALATRAKQVAGFDELDIPVVEQMAPSAFDPQAVISQIESGKNYKLGGSAPYYAAENYLIPAGAVITGGIDLDGNYSGPRRTLYVAGKLTLSSVSIARVTLAVLKGGVVEIGSATNNNAINDVSIYVFEGGRFKANTLNLSSKAIVNKGTFEVTQRLDANSNGLGIYNFAGGEMNLEVADIDNTELHNDGMLTIDAANGTSNAKFYNWENGTFDIADFYSANGSVELWQRGIAHFDDFRMSGGKFYFLCYTTIGEMHGDNGNIEIATGVGLEVKETNFNSGVKMSLASGSLFTISELFKTGGADFTSEAKKNSDQTAAVIVIADKADCALWGTSFKGGPLEVVSKEPLNGKLFSNGSNAYWSSKQTVVIPATVCNGGKAPVEPEPDPLPENEYAMQEGLVNTYCFEDSWPWLGDYDMNDAVVEVRIDRELSKDGGLVKSLVINWALKAAGGQNRMGCAVQLDRVAASKVADVVLTYQLGSGFFSNGLEAGSELAIVPFFNATSDLLSSWNTFKERPEYAQPVAHKTTITFKEPISSDDVVESAMNFFVVVGVRSREIHMTGYATTSLGGVVTGNCLPESPYKFYNPDKDQAKNNNMMWVLKVPGSFRYPAEMKDIRNAYKNFSAWALSGGTAHKDWYSAEDGFDASLVY